MAELDQNEKAVSIETVLCAFDFSETAQVALSQARRFARRHGAKLVLAHVVESIPLEMYPTVVPPGDDLALDGIARKQLDEVAESVRANDLVVETRIEEGRPGAVLVSIAQEVGADLVVVGTRGLSGVKHLLLGSTAEFIVRRCACPVLTIHPEDRPLKDKIETVVLPTDLSESAADAARYFKSLFGAWERPKVHLVYADRTPPYLEPFRHETLKRMHQRDVVKENIEAKMAPLAEFLRSADFPVEVAVLDGEPVAVTANLAKDCDADLILLSTNGRSAIANTMLGRTAQRIVQHAPCPVLTVRPGFRTSRE